MGLDNAQDMQSVIILTQNWIRSLPEYTHPKLLYRFGTAWFAYSHTGFDNRQISRMNLIQE